MKYKINTILIAMMIAFLNINISSAQTLIPAITGDLIAENNITSILNTGNDLIYFDQNLFQISVWDGSNPSFGWDPCNGPEPSFSLSTLWGTATDPDIVVGVDGSFLYAFIIYIASNDVIIEIHRYYQGTWTNIQTKQITSNHICKSPNIDVDINGNVTAIWEEDNKIRILYTDIQYSYNNIQTLLDGGTNIVRDPDIAIFNTSNINFTYILETASSQTLYGNYINTWNSNTFTTKVSESIISPDYYGIPRIGTMNNSFSDFFEIVVDKHTSSTNSIWGFNYNSINSPVGPTLINDGLELDYNTSPVVSFANNSSYISVVWTHESSLSNHKDIIQKKIYTNGSIPTNHNFQVVNKTTTNNQTIPSVSGKNSTGHRVLYSFFNDNSNEVQYKESYIGNSYVRLNKYTAKPLIRPNPASDFITINIANDEDFFDIEIYDNLGKIVLKREQIKNNSNISISNFNSGIYTLRITGKYSSTTTKLIKI